MQTQAYNPSYLRSDSSTRYISLPWYFNLVRRLLLLMLLLHELGILAERQIWVRLAAHPATADLAADAGSQLHVVGAGLRCGAGPGRECPGHTGLQDVVSPEATLLRGRECRRDKYPHREQNVPSQPSHTHSVSGRTELFNSKKKKTKKQQSLQKFQMFASTFYIRKLGGGNYSTARDTVSDLQLLPWAHAFTRRF